MNKTHTRSELFCSPDHDILERLYLLLGEPRQRTGNGKRPEQLLLSVEDRRGDRCQFGMTITQRNGPAALPDDGELRISGVPAIGSDDPSGRAVVERKPLSLTQKVADRPR